MPAVSSELLILPYLSLALPPFRLSLSASICCLRKHRNSSGAFFLANHPHQSSGQYQCSGATSASAMSDPTECAPADTAITTAIVVDRPAATTAESTTTEPTTDPNQPPQTNSKPRIDVAVVIDMVSLMIPFHSFIHTIARKLLLLMLFVQL